MSDWEGTAVMKEAIQAEVGSRISKLEKQAEEIAQRQLIEADVISRRIKTLEQEPKFKQVTAEWEVTVAMKEALTEQRLTKLVKRVEKLETLAKNMGELEQRQCKELENRQRTEYETLNDFVAALRDVVNQNHMGQCQTASRIEELEKRQISHEEWHIEKPVIMPGPPEQGRPRTMPDKLNECYWCGAIAVVWSVYFYQDRWQVECSSSVCNARGPVRKTKRGAITAWNQRREEK